MTEEKMILNDGQYDEQYDLAIKTHQISVSADVLAGKGWYKLADDEQIVKKAVLSKEEAEWFEKHKDLPYFDGDSDDYFSQKVFDKMMEYREGFEDWKDFKDWKKPNDFHNRLSQAYFTGYTIKKEKKYYIKLNFNRVFVCLNVNEISDNWFFETRTEISFYKNQFTQTEIDEMQKDPRAKGLDLNMLKIEVSEDELED